MTRYFVDANGVYLGGFDGQSESELAELLPDNFVEISSPPEDGRDIYNGGTWTKYVEPAKVDASILLVNQVIADPAAVSALKRALGL